MIKLRNYIYLRSKGVGIKNASKEIQGIGKTIIYVLTLILCVLAVLLVLNYKAEIDNYQISLKIESLQHKTNALHYEKMVLNCLNGHDLLVDGENRPCKVGKYEDGKVKI